MNKKSSLKKKSSLLPFLALPAAGALAGGAYYWQQNNGEDAGLSKQEKAKRLLRCLILGGATGLGAATAYTGGKMTYDNLIKDSSYKKKVTKNTLLKQLVKKSSKKRNLLKLLVKQAADPIQIPEYDGNINSNYLIGGGLGLLGGLGLYHFLNNEEAKKKGLGGYIGAGLTGLSAGLLGAGAYNQTQHGKLFDEKNEYAGKYFTPDDPKHPTVYPDPNKEFIKTTYNGQPGRVGNTPNSFMVQPKTDMTTSEGDATVAETPTTEKQPLGYSALNLLAGPQIQVADAALESVGLDPGDVGGLGYNGVGNLGLTTLGSGISGGLGGLLWGTGSYLWDNGVPTKEKNISNRIAQSDAATERLNTRAKEQPYRWKLPKSWKTAVPSFMTSSFSYPWRVASNWVTDTFDKRLQLTPAEQQFVDLAGVKDALKPGALDIPDIALKKIENVFKPMYGVSDNPNKPTEYDKRFNPKFEEGKTFSLDPSDFGGDANKQGLYNKKLFMDWVASKVPGLVEQETKPAKPSIGTRISQGVQPLVNNTTNGIGKLIKKIKELTKAKQKEIPVEPKVETGHPKVDAFLNGETVNKPEAPKPNPATGNKAPTSPLNNGEPKPNAKWVNGESNFGGQLNKTYQEIFGGKPIGDQFVENSPVSPVKATEVNPNTQGTPEAQNGTETAQNKKHLTLEQELAEEYKRIEPRPGAVIDPNTGEEVVVNAKLYKKQLREDETKFTRIINDSNVPDAQKEVLREEVTKCKTILKYLSEGVKRFGKGLMRGAERAGEGAKHH